MDEAPDYQIRAMQATCHHACVVTVRRALAGANLVLAMLASGACAQFNEAVDGRDLECTAVPDGICARLADDIVGHWDPADAAIEGPIVKITVGPGDCGAVERPDPAIARCWAVEASTAGLADGSGRSGIRWVYSQHVDGSLFDGDGQIVGT